MKLRICDGEHESVVPASLEMVEQAFAAEISVRIGTEISVGPGLAGYRPVSSIRQMSLSRSEAVK